MPSISTNVSSGSGIGVGTIVGFNSITGTVSCISLYLLKHTIPSKPEYSLIPVLL